MLNTQGKKMKLSQQMLYLCEQLNSFEEAVRAKSNEIAFQQFKGKDSLPIGSNEHIKYELHKHFYYL